MFPDVMVDLETGGTDPEHAPILQIAAVRFNHQTGSVDADDMFNACLRVPSNRYWSDDTVNWWNEQNPEVLKRILSRAEDPRDVVKRFWDWSTVSSNVTPPVMWAKPISFEFPFLSSYFRQYDLPNPFPFYLARDVRSFCAGVTFPNPPISDKAIPFEGDAHDAIFDVLHQIKYVLRVIEERKAGITG